MKALALTGGGSKGAFQVGALKYLMREKKESYHYISGVSVGSLNASFLAQYNHEESELASQELEKLWNKVNTRKIYKNWPFFRKLSVLWKNALYNNEPLQNLLKENINLDDIKNSNIKLNVESVSINTGERRNTTDQDKHLFKAIIASTAVPFFFKPVEVLPKQFDFDGSLRDFAPLKEILKQNPEHVTIITTDPLRVPEINPKNMGAFSVIQRVLAIYMDETVRNDIEGFIKINELIKNGATVPGKKYIPYTLITPNKQLTNDSLDFDPNKLSEMMEIGYETAKKFSIDG